MLRGVVASKYLKPGVPTFTEMISDNNDNVIRVNNRDREDSLYVSFGHNYFLEYPQRFKIMITILLRLIIQVDIYHPKLVVIIKLLISEE